MIKIIGLYLQYFGLSSASTSIMDGMVSNSAKKPLKYALTGFDMWVVGLGV